MAAAVLADHTGDGTGGEQQMDPTGIKVGL